MTNILLMCSAGISTGIMVKRTQEAAAERKIKAEIWVVDNADTVNNVEKMDVMLLGPQVRFLESKMKAIAGGKPVAIIGMQTYGIMNGVKVLEQALRLLGM